MTEDLQTARTENALYTMPEGMMKELALVAQSFVGFAAADERAAAAVVFKEIASLRQDVDASIIDGLIADYDDLPEEAKAMLSGELAMLRQGSVTSANASMIRAAFDTAKSKCEMDRVQQHAEDAENERALQEAREHAKHVMDKYAEYSTDEEIKRTAELQRELEEAKRSGDPERIAAAQKAVDEDMSARMQAQEDRLRVAGKDKEADEVKDARAEFEAQRAKDAESNVRDQQQIADVAAANPNKAPNLTTNEQALLAELGIPSTAVGNEELMNLPAPAAPAGPANAPATGRA